MGVRRNTRVLLRGKRREIVAIEKDIVLVGAEVEVPKVVVVAVWDGYPGFVPSVVAPKGACDILESSKGEA